MRHVRHELRRSSARALFVPALLKNSLLEASSDQCAPHALATPAGPMSANKSIDVAYAPSSLVAPQAGAEGASLRLFLASMQAATSGDKTEDDVPKTMLRLLAPHRFVPALLDRLSGTCPPPLAVALAAVRACSA